jgi:hypothetical protein
VVDTGMISPSCLFGYATIATPDPQRQSAVGMGEIAKIDTIASDHLRLLYQVHDEDSRLIDVNASVTIEL